MSFLLLIYLLLLHVSQLQKYKIQAFTEKKKKITLIEDIRESMNQYFIYVYGRCLLMLK